MSNTEIVMAVLCAPLSARALLSAEKKNNVFIIRRLEYDSGTNYFSGDSFITNQSNSPLRLMFVFGEGDAIIVRNGHDKEEVCKRLSAAFV